jgi:hypothetical protein
MKNNTDELIEMDFEITEILSNYDPQDFLKESQKVWLKKGFETGFVKIPDFDNEEEEREKRFIQHENILKNTASEESESNYYCPLNEKQNDTKLLYILSLGSLFFLSILINSIFG